MDLTFTHERYGSSMKEPNGTLRVNNLKNRDRPINADFIRLVYYLHATSENKAYLDAIDPVDAEVRHEEDAAGGRRDRELRVALSRCLIVQA